MTEDQKDFIVEMIRNTVEYLHKQEVLLIQLAGSIEMQKENPDPTPAEKTAVESEEFYKRLEEDRRNFYKEYGFPCGNAGEKKGPGVTNVIAEDQPTPIRDAMVHGVPITPGDGVPILCTQENTPRGAWE